MKTQRMLRFAGLAVATLAVAAVVASGKQEPAESAVSSGRRVVRMLTSKDLGAANALAPGDRGATYYWLEGRASRVTVRYPDAIAISERGADGALRTRLSDTTQNDLATFDVSRIGSGADVLAYRPSGRSPMLAARPADVHPTLTWSGQQAYRLWKDARGGDPSTLEWRDGLMRGAASRRHALDDDAVEIRTDWPDDLSATVSKEAGVRKNVLTGQPITGHRITGRFQQHGVSVGVVSWFPEEQVLAWDFPGVTQGYLTPERLQKIGGWTFAPDMAWASVQGFAFKHFHDDIAARGFVGRNDAGWPEKILGFLAPTLHANQAGCDGLHWLDGSVFRYCCDVHDWCYQKFGCTSSSWWQWWKSWSCDSCNVGAVFCFADTGLPPYGGPYYY
ncbi:MAG TPA: hypothetical protein VNE16_09690 [Vicinamibacterales bacterium]|nr:hypothetical protein [Vicinamibacterales bacterium]